MSERCERYTPSGRCRNKVATEAPTRNSSDTPVSLCAKHATKEQRLVYEEYRRLLWAMAWDRSQV
jgi:hypothetical protein